MLRSVKDLRGYTVRATDGDIGEVQEFYFDDLNWTIRYLVVETGNWLIRRFARGWMSADLPGLKPEDVDISITENTLTIKSEFRSEEEGERGNVHFQERRYGKFQRSITLPSSVDAHAAEAEFEDGVLKVSLPKSEEAKPKQIKVKAKS